MFQKTQPKTTEDIKSNYDCMIRSVAIATGADYAQVHKLMYGFGWRASRRRSKGKWEEQITKTLDALGFKATRISYPAVKGQPRMTGNQLKSEDKDNTYIIRVAKHVACIQEGTLKDTWNCGGKCVYFAWKVEKK